MIEKGGTLIGHIKLDALPDTECVVLDNNGLEVQFLFFNIFLLLFLFLFINNVR